MQGVLHLAGALAAPLVLACLLWAGPAGAHGQPVAPTLEEVKALEGLKGMLPGEIVFSSRRDGKWRLFRVLPDGADLARLSSGLANHTRPFFVQGGAKLIYHSDEQGPVQIWMAEPDLSQPKRLSPEGKEEHFQGMTADGRLMLVARSLAPPVYLLRDMKAGRDTLVDFSAHGVKAGRVEAMLSPDGEKIAYQFRNGGEGEPERGVYIMDLGADGRAANPRRVADGCFTAWRSDSRALLTSQFASLRGAPGADIWLADDRGPRDQLTRNLDWNYYPAFSPDERWMVWAMSPLHSHDPHTGKYEIYVKRLYDKHPVRLTFHTAPDIDPTWRAARGKLKSPAPDFVYEAEDFLHGQAAVVVEPGASGGRAVLARLDAPQAGAIVYGQYDVLTAGRYLARFRLKFSPPRENGLVAELDVCTDSGKRILARLPIRGDQVKPGAYRDYELAFTSDQLLTSLECRVSFHPGVSDLYVDVITVQPAGAPPWHQPLKNAWSRLFD